MNIPSPETEEMDTSEYLDEMMDLRFIFEYAEAYEGDGDEEDDDDAGDEGDEDDDPDESEEDEDEDDDSEPTLEQLKEQNRKLRAEARKRRLENKRLKKAAANGSKADEDKDDKESESKLAEANERAEKAEATAIARSIQLALRDGLAKHNLDPKKASAIERVIDADMIDINDDGEVEGMDEALEDIVENFPEWVIKPVSKKKDADDDEDDDEDETPKTKGRSTKSKGGSKKDLNSSSLTKKYPALQGR